MYILLNSNRYIYIYKFKYYNNFDFEINTIIRKERDMEKTIQIYILIKNYFIKFINY